MKKYMIVEHFKSSNTDAVYGRLDQKGRMLPEGLYYLHSWVNKEKSICFQLMETNDQKLIEKWIDKWKDLIEFEVFPID